MDKTKVFGNKWARLGGFVLFFGLLWVLIQFLVLPIVWEDAADLPLYRQFFLTIPPLIVCIGVLSRFGLIGEAEESEEDSEAG